MLTHRPFGDMPFIVGQHVPGKAGPIVSFKGAEIDLIGNCQGNVVRTGWLLRSRSD
jgi:hypothetical protein